MKKLRGLITLSMLGLTLTSCGTNVETKNQETTNQGSTTIETTVTTTKEDVTLNIETTSAEVKELEFYEYALWGGQGTIMARKYYCETLDKTRLLEQSGEVYSLDIIGEIVSITKTYQSWKIYDDLLVICNYNTSEDKEYIYYWFDNGESIGYYSNYKMHIYNFIKGDSE